MELKDYQQEAVNQLVSLAKKYLKGGAKPIYLDAPTGSGKTVMASAAMEEISGTLPFEYDGQFEKVAFIWIAPNTLQIQSYKSMKSYFKATNNMRPMVWDEIDHTLGQLEHGDVLFLNWASINTVEGDHINLIWKQTETQEDLQGVINNTHDAHVAIVVVIDEEHIYGENAKKVMHRINPDVTIRISATPKYPADGNYQPVKIDRDDVVREQMIKKDVIINSGFDASEAENYEGGETAFFIMKALQKRQALKRAYTQIGSPVNPLLLIQLPNDNRGLNAADNNKMNEIKTYLADPKIDITETNEKLAIWLSEDKKNLDKIAEPNNMTEVLIFKEAVSKGWDCPRAAVLLIFREIKSCSFAVQTVGRILRMPQQKHYSNDALNHGYIYTNVQNDHIIIEPSTVQYDLKLNTFEAVLRNNITSLSLPAESVGTMKVQNTLGYRFRRILRETFIEEWQLNQMTLNFAPTEDVVIDPNNVPAEGELFERRLTKEQEENREKFVRNAHLDLDVHKLYSIFPKDMTIDPGRVGVYEVPKNGRASVAKTQGEVDRLFKNFCLANLIKFDKRDSTSAMSEAILEFMRKFGGYTDIETKRIVLFNQNRPKFVSVLKKAQERYARDMAERMEVAKTMQQKYTWTMPTSRAYKSDTHHAEQAPGHALQPFYELNKVSGPEMLFRDFLTKNSDSIFWWYKNGDSGKENFSVIYQNNQGKQANFYVDFIIMLRNERICLFDTKSSTGDSESVNKHNALIDYIKNLNDKNGTNIIGGIIIQDGGRWLYSPMHIDSAANHAGWRAFEPEELNK